MSNRRVVLVGGGSGGHFYPLMAVAEALQTEAKKEQLDMPKLYYMGPRAYDEKSLMKFDIEHVWCPAGKWRRYKSALNILDIFKNSIGLTIAIWKLFKIYPDVIMSKGSFTSVPVVIAAWLLRIPIIIHESDAVPGAANKLASHFARYIAITYEESAEHFPKKKIALTGIPVRNALLAERSPDAEQMLGIHHGRPMILVLGGSQGAERVNELVLESLKDLLPSFTIVHQTGEAHFPVIVETIKTLIPEENLRHHYVPAPFFPADKLNQALHTASLVISRAGSGTIYEIALHGKPSILIPIPENVSHDQRANAYAYAHTGAAIVMEEKNLLEGLLMAEISRIMDDQETYRLASEAALGFGVRDGAEKLAHTVLAVAEEH